MAFQKFGDNQEAEVFTGNEAGIVNRHMQRTGKAVSDFDQDELTALNQELESVRESKESTSAESTEPQQKQATDKDETSSAKSGSTKKVKPLN